MEQEYAVIDSVPATRFLRANAFHLFTRFTIKGTPAARTLYCKSELSIYDVR